MEIYSILSHETRRKILQLLEREGVLPFSAFLPHLKLETSGKLNFHLKKMGDLVKKSGKNYMLTEEGKLALKIMKLNDNIISGTQQVDQIDKDDIGKIGITRIGVIICSCAEEISCVLDIEELKRYVAGLKNVVSVRIVDRLCDIREVKGIKDWIDQFFINRIVVASCSPRTHSFVFEDIFEGLLPVEVIKNTEFANIREQCVWVHDSDSSDPLISLEKAKILIEAAIDRVILQEDIEVKEIIRTQKSVAVIGGGLAGINLSLSFARAGLEVFLIEKSPTLGGKIARWSTIQDVKECASCYLTELISRVVKEKNVKIFTNTTVERVSGHVGNFEIELLIHPRYVDVDDCTGCKRCSYVCPNEKPDEYEFGLKQRKLICIPFSNAYPYASVIDEESIEDCRNCRLCEESCPTNAINLDEKAKKLRINVGAKVLAIGSDLFQDLSAYQHNPNNDVLTSAEFERILASDGPTRGKLIKLSDGKPPKSIAIIQCVGGIDKCSTYCCTLTKKYIDEIEKRLPECELHVFYDISRIPHEARMWFTPEYKIFHWAKILKVEVEGTRKFIATESDRFEPDMIILNIGMIPNKSLKTLRESALDFSLDSKGFMSDITLASGIFGCGSVRGPADYPTTISATNDVAIQVIGLLSKDHLIPEMHGITIDTNKCGFCGLCATSCPYRAISIDSEDVIIDQFSCKGCGICVAVCPTKAIEMRIDTTPKMMKTIETYSRFSQSPKIIAFACESCGYSAADDAGLKKIQYTPNVLIIKVPCTGRVDTRFITYSFEQGFDGVLVIGCQRDSCKYIDGFSKAEKRVELLKKIAPELENKLHLIQLSAIDSHKFASIVNDFYKRLSGLESPTITATQ
ncbi:MAG: hydrogenase iron-sulfur subunit [Promethearchaeota archaeon]